MMPKLSIVLLVAVGVLSAPVPHTRVLIGEPEIRHYALVRRGQRPFSEKALASRPPGWYCEPASCGYEKCLNGSDCFIRPSSVDRHWVEWHQGAIPPGWKEPETKPVPESGRGIVRVLPVGETTRSLLVMQRFNKDFPAAAQYVKAQREARNLFTGHLQVPAMRQTLGAPRRGQTRTEAQRQRRRDLQASRRRIPDTELSAAQQVALDTKLAARREQQRRTRRFRCQNRRDAQFVVTDVPGSSTQQTAPPTTQQLITFQPPVTFTNSAFSSIHNAQHNISPIQEAGLHIPPKHSLEQPSTQPHTQPPTRGLDIDLNYPPERQHLDLNRFPTERQRGHLRMM